jgi:tetratricopeptide (TPR) repeat protein
MEAAGMALKQQGNKAFAAGQYESAIGLYKQASTKLASCGAQAATELGKVHANAAECHLRLKSWSAAESAAGLALEADPQNTKAQFRRGKARFEQCKYAGAISDLEGVSSKEARLLVKAAREKERRSERQATLAAALGGDDRANTGFFPSSMDKNKCFGLLIDSYRLRVEDEYTMTGDVDERSLYGGTPTPLPHFKAFIKKAATKGLLPSWWAETEAESMATLCEMAVTHEWHNIKYAAEKSDMLEHYNMLELPMLRALAEKVRGPVFGYGDESDDDYDDDYGSDDGDEEWVTTDDDDGDDDDDGVESRTRKMTKACNKGYAPWQRPPYTPHDTDEAMSSQQTYMESAEFTDKFSKGPPFEDFMRLDLRAVLRGRPDQHHFVRDVLLAKKFGKAANGMAPSQFAAKALQCMTNLKEECKSVVGFKFWRNEGPPISPSDWHFDHYGVVVSLVHAAYASLSEDQQESIAVQKRLTEVTLGGWEDILTQWQIPFGGDEALDDEEQDRWNGPTTDDLGLDEMPDSWTKGCLMSVEEIKKIKKKKKGKKKKKDHKKKKRGGRSHGSDDEDDDDTDDDDDRHTEDESVALMTRAWAIWASTIEARELLWKAEAQEAVGGFIPGLDVALGIPGATRATIHSHVLATCERALELPCLSEPAVAQAKEDYHTPAWDCAQDPPIREVLTRLTCCAARAHLAMKNPAGALELVQRAREPQTFGSGSHDSTARPALARLGILKARCLGRLRQYREARDELSAILDQIKTERRMQSKGFRNGSKRHLKDKDSGQYPDSDHEDGQPWDHVKEECLSVLQAEHQVAIEGLEVLKERRSALPATEPSASHAAGWSIFDARRTDRVDNALLNNERLSVGVWHERNGLCSPSTLRLHLKVEGGCGLNGIEAAFPGVEELVVDDVDECCRVGYDLRPLALLAPKLVHLELRLSGQWMCEGDEDTLTPIGSLPKLRRLAISRLRDGWAQVLKPIEKLHDLELLYFEGSNELYDGKSTFDLSGMRKLRRVSFVEASFSAASEQSSSKQALVLPSQVEEAMFVPFHASRGTCTAALRQELEEHGIVVREGSREGAGAGTGDGGGWYPLLP